MIKKEKFKLVWQSPPFSDACTMYKLQQLKFEKERMILITAKYTHNCTKHNNLLPSKQFSKAFLNFIIFLLKMEKKIYNYDLNYHRYMVQPLYLRILRCSL